MCVCVCLPQNHLLSVFDNTRLVTFDEKVYDKILAINSQEGEKVDLDEPVMAQVSRSSVLNVKVVIEMVKTLMLFYINMKLQTFH